jgi:phosphatidylglycerophosphate synthase
MFGRVAEIYRQSRKQKDNFWTEILTRPFAALALVGLERTPVTPNQVTFLSLLVAVLAAVVLVAWPGWAGLVVAALVLQASYVLDCVDGQLARLRGIGSPIGHLLDFLMDEIKAFLILAAVSTRLYLERCSIEELLLGLWGLAVLASGISITSFSRRPEYLQATARATHASPKKQNSILFSLERIAKFLIHYPSYFMYLAFFNRLEWYLYLYVGINTLYLARALLSIVRSLGRPGFRPPLPGPAPSSPAEPECRSESMPSPGVRP